MGAGRLQGKDGQEGGHRDSWAQVREYSLLQLALSNANTLSEMALS